MSRPTSCSYAKLMGYSAISPDHASSGRTANYSEPLNGYMSVNIDDHGYWAWKRYDPKAGEKASGRAVPGKESQHVRYLAATKQYGPRTTSRASNGAARSDLPKEAWAIGVDGQPAKPNRFAPVVRQSAESRDLG